VIAKKGAHQLGMKGVAGALGDDSTSESEAKQSEVSDDIERLVSHEFVLGPRVGQKPIIAYHYRAFDRAALSQAPGAHGLNIFEKTESPGEGQLAPETLFGDVESDALSANQGMIEVDRIVDLEIVGGFHQNETIVIRGSHAHRPAYDERALEGGQVLDPSFVDKVQKHPRRAVKNRNLRTIDFDANVIDPSRVQRGEKMLNRHHLSAVALQGHCQFLLCYPLYPGWNFPAFAISPHEHNAGVGGCRQKAKRNQLS
jgi:hypothetical protein